MCLSTKIVNLYRTDAFSFSWSHFFAYIFPPFNTILKVLISKQDRNGRGRLCRYSSVFENTGLVSKACSPHDRCTDFTNRVQTSLATSSPPTSHLGQVQDDSLPLIRKSCEQAAFQQALSASSSLHGGEEQGNNTIRLPPPKMDTFLLSAG